MTTYPDATPDWEIPLLKGNVVNDWRQINDGSLAVDAAITRATKDATFAGATLLDPIVRDELRFAAEGTGAPDASLKRTGAGTLRLSGADASMLEVSAPNGNTARFGKSTAAPGYQLANNLKPDASSPSGWVRDDPAQGAALLSGGGANVLFGYSVKPGANPVQAADVLTRFAWDANGTLNLYPDAGANALHARGPLKVDDRPLYVGKAGSGTGGALCLLDDTGVFRWLVGHSSSPGEKRFAIFNIAAGSTMPLDISETTGTVALHPAPAQAALIGHFGNNGSLWLTPGNAANSRIATGTGNLELDAVANVVHPSRANAISLGATNMPWSVLYAQNGTVQPSAAAVKTAIAPLDPGASLAAALATDPAEFTYTVPARPWRDYQRSGRQRFDWRAERDRLRNAPLERAARTQRGFVLDDPTGRFRTDPMFVTGRGQSNAANSVGVLLAAIKDLDARLRVLEGAA